MINLFSGPRNVSTALMYSFAQRPDTKVVDEPWYGYYLVSSGVTHPGRDEVIHAMETDPEKVFKSIFELGGTSKILFIKNMSHHFINLDLSLLLKFKNIFLIRNPVDMLPSLVNQIPDPVLRDTGLRDQWNIFNRLCDLGQIPLVLESSILLSNPEGILSRLCQYLNIPFFKSMLSWKKGGRPEDGIWAKYWYQKLHESDGFEAYHKRSEPFPGKLLPLLNECRPYYEKLFKHVITLYHERPVNT